MGLKYGEEKLSGVRGNFQTPDILGVPGDLQDTFRGFKAFLKSSR